MDSDIALDGLREERIYETTGYDGLRRRFQPQSESQREVNLPQADRGKDAWLFLAGCPILFAAFKRWPSIRRSCVFAGLFINVTAIVAASFATTVSHLILTQGCLYACGGVMMYCPTIVFLDEWFIQRKGLAFGMMWAGTGVSGVVLPFVMSGLLSKFGFRTTLRAYAVAFLILAIPLLSFIRPRLPLAQTSLQRRLDMGFLRSSTFLIPQTCNIVQGLGYFIPSIYLPTYALSQGMTSVQGTVMVALLNMGVVFGAIWAGALTDRMHVSSVMCICSVGAALAVFLFWGLALSLPMLCLFSLIYGLTAGGFSSNYTGIVQKVKDSDNTADTGMVFGFLAAGRGIGAVASGPLSEALLHMQTWKGEAKLGYGTGYGLLIVFTGVTAIAGGASWFARRIGFS
ncbi:MAG: hypothetical protein L6R41_000800 [Letrouitia leprolyta]|nr:MAG: hypothetical protein L6R41_000800 [Letrouitia leprolyta]